jgi:putative Ca2+/H+ antiporter (TMEM165/GDT1 family)
VSSFLFGFALVLLVSLGARDQLLVARMAGRTGPGLLVAGAVAATLSACLMAWAGQVVAVQLFPEAGKMLVAIALVVAAVELIWPIRQQAPREPTHSIFAAFVVLLARQIGDAGRFLVFAISAWTALPRLAAAGGALAGTAALLLGWTMGGALESSLPLRLIRRVLAAVLFLAALVIGLGVRGMI